MQGSWLLETRVGKKKKYSTQRGEQDAAFATVWEHTASLTAGWIHLGMQQSHVSQATGQVFSPDKVLFSELLLLTHNLLSLLHSTSMFHNIL